MPTVVVPAQGANGQAHDWADIQAIIDYLNTLLNSTKLDYINVQDFGLRTAQIRSYANVQSGFCKIRNASGATLNANTLVYISGTYSDGTDTYPSVVKAVVTQSRASTYYAHGIIHATVSNNADGTMALCKEVTGLNTNSLSLGAPIWLSHTAGSYNTSRTDHPDVDYLKQVVGWVTKVDATDGRILFSLPGSVVPWSIADEV